MKPEEEAVETEASRPEGSKLPAGGKRKKKKSTAEAKPAKKAKNDASTADTTGARSSSKRSKDKIKADLLHAELTGVQEKMKSEAEARERESAQRKVGPCSHPRRLLPLQGADLPFILFRRTARSFLSVRFATTCLIPRTA